MNTGGNPSKLDVLKDINRSVLVTPIGFSPRCGHGPRLRQRYESTSVLVTLVMVCVIGYLGIAQVTASLSPVTFGIAIYVITLCVMPFPSHGTEIATFLTRCSPAPPRD